MRPVLKYPPAKAYPVHLARHTNVTENQIYDAARFLKYRYGFIGASGLPDLEALFVQVDGKGEPDHRLVINHQYGLFVCRGVAFGLLAHTLRPPSNGREPANERSVPYARKARENTARTNSYTDSAADFTKD